MPEVRQAIRQEVAGIQPLDELEAAHQKDVLDWIDGGAGLFRVESPDVPPKHLVSYFVLADLALGQVLLVHHRKANLWLPTGGHVEPGEHPRTTAERECLEELGARAVFVRPEAQFVTVTQTVNTNNPHTDVSLWYVLEGKSDMPLLPDAGEFHEARWWSTKEVLNAPVATFDPNFHRFVRKVWPDAS